MRDFLEVVCAPRPTSDSTPAARLGHVKRTQAESVAFPTHLGATMSDASSIATATTLVDVDLRELKKSSTLLEEPVLLVTRLRVRGWYVQPRGADAVRRCPIC